MLNFRLMERSKIKEYAKYYDYSNALGCDVNLLNAYFWRHEYNISFAVFDETLIKAYFKPDGSVWGYCLPTGKNVSGALELIFEDSRERAQKPRIVMLTNEQRARLEELCPNRFVYSRSPENQDYIYLSEELASLSGKKFHAKRNHISKFYRTYDNSRFECINDKNKSDAMAVVLEWYAENDLSPDQSSEVAAIREGLESLDEFNMSGAVLYVGEKPVAMTLGSEISSRVYDVNFEKALRGYDGVYAVINNEFTKTLTRYKYINREEDMGLEGLRKSKLSYNPAIILDRFNAEMIYEAGTQTL